MVKTNVLPDSAFNHRTRKLQKHDEQKGTSKMRRVSSSISTIQFFINLIVLLKDIMRSAYRAGHCLMQKTRCQWTLSSRQMIESKATPLFSKYSPEIIGNNVLVLLFIPASH